MKAILEIDMPDNCGECFLEHRTDDAWGCVALAATNHNFSDRYPTKTDARRPDCPLVEVRSGDK